MRRNNSLKLSDILFGDLLKSFFGCKLHRNGSIKLLLTGLLDSLGFTSGLGGNSLVLSDGFSDALSDSGFTLDDYGLGLDFL